MDPPPCAAAVAACVLQAAVDRNARCCAPGPAAGNCAGCRPRLTCDRLQGSTLLTEAHRGAADDDESGAVVLQEQEQGRGRRRPRGRNAEGVFAEHARLGTKMGDALTNSQGEGSQGVRPRPAISIDPAHLLADLAPLVIHPEAREVRSASWDLAHRPDRPEAGQRGGIRLAHVKPSLREGGPSPRQALLSLLPITLRPLKLFQGPSGLWRARFQLTAHAGSMGRQGVLQTAAGAWAAQVRVLYVAMLPAVKGAPLA
jgi:hypothetical protein